MLLIMTMNAWVLMFILIGATISYFFLASKKKGTGSERSITHINELI
jgi:hypothetical protein